MQKLAWMILAVMPLAACTTVRLDTCCVPRETVPEFRTFEIVGADSALHGQTMKEDPLLLKSLRRQFAAAFPAAHEVTEGGDIAIIFVMVDYKPGCAPRCAKPPTYRNWSGEVSGFVEKPGLNRAFGTQVLNVEGETYNPFVDPVRVFVKRFKHYWEGVRHPAPLDQAPPPGTMRVVPQPSVPAKLDGVEIRFEKRGALLDLGSQRLAESGTAPVTAGEDYWLRLTNRSPYTIEIPTQSMYFTRPPELVRIGPTTSVFAVRDGAVLVVLFQSFEGRYGFGDMSFRAYLPAGRSVLFQVPKKYLSEKHGIFVDFRAYPESVLRGEGEPLVYRVSFNLNDSP